MYKLIQTREARDDLEDLVAYMIYSLKNEQAARSSLNQYEKWIQNLAIFPFGYREIGFKYRGYKICMKPFSSYNIFFVVDAKTYQIIINLHHKYIQHYKMTSTPAHHKQMKNLM